MSLHKFYQKKIYPNIDYLFRTLDSTRYRNFSIKLPDNFLQTDALHFRKILKITNGEFEYDYFNFCYLHNILSLMVYACYHHAYPLIRINESDKDRIQWEWYFQQPAFNGNPIHLPQGDCPHTNVSFQPHFEDIYNPAHVRLWGKLYANFLHFNKETEKYIQSEYQTLFSGKKKVLGVICRGTDYTTLHPPGHPIQPPVKDIVSLCKKRMSDSGYDAIYLATEEKQIRDIFSTEFPGLILENKRKYYDDIYYSSHDIQYIKDVRFDRENNNYWMGLEYLSSIVLLSQCESLIGGNCGGTMAAIFFNNGRYKYTNIFNLGLYP